MRSDLVTTVYETLVDIVNAGFSDDARDQPFAAVLVKLAVEVSDLDAHALQLVQMLKQEVNANSNAKRWHHQDRGSSIWASRATTHSEGSHVHHAELNVLISAEQDLYEAVFGQKGHLFPDEKPEDERPAFYMFVNASSCPMCMTALIKSQVFNIFFFGPHNKFANPPGPSAAKLAKRTNKNVGRTKFRVERIGRPLQQKYLKRQIDNAPKEMNYDGTFK